MPLEKPPIRAFKKHVMICTGPRCAPETSASLYEHFRDKLKEMKLHEGEGRVQKTQCHCLGVCQGGPIVTVYPDGVWYHHVTPEKMDRILQQHVVEGKPVEEDILYRV